MFFVGLTKSCDNAIMLSKRFRLAREHNGLTQEAVAEITGISQTAIFKIEKGQTLRPRNIEKFAKLFNCTPEWLTHDVNPPEWLSRPSEVQDTRERYNQSSNLPSSSKVHIPTENEKKLLYISFIKAQESLEKTKDIWGDDYDFKALIKAALMQYEDDAIAGVDPISAYEELENELTKDTTSTKAG